MADLTPTVYLPVEEANRELDARLLLALELVRHGVTVIVGQQWLMGGNFRYMPAGVVMMKGLNALPAFAMKHAGKFGHVPIAADEEALGLADPSYMARDIDLSIAGVCRAYLAQGTVHASAIASCLEVDAGSISIVGNARLDILRSPFREAHRAEAERLAGVHGEYVLFDTNHGSINSAWGSIDAYRNILIRIGWLDPARPGDNSVFEQHVATDKANIVEFRRVLSGLAHRFPDITFIVRPHPSERMQPWKKAYAERKNISVVREGDHLPWILGSRLMLHTGCTTGLEAELLDHPAISILPRDHAALDCPTKISNLANLAAVGADEAIRLATAVLQGDSSLIESGRAQRRAALSRHVEALDGDYAYQRTATVILRILADAGATDRHADWEPTRPDKFLTSRAEMARVIGDEQRTAYLTSKFAVDLEALMARVERLRRMTANEFGTEVREIADSVFLIRSAA
jgi:surface carbohydrate biosynthesis protein